MGTTWFCGGKSLVSLSKPMVAGQRPLKPCLLEFQGLPSTKPPILLLSLPRSSPSRRLRHSRRPRVEGTADGATQRPKGRTRGPTEHGVTWRSSYGTPQFERASFEALCWRNQTLKPLTFLTLAWWLNGMSILVVHTATGLGNGS